jgi:hypothetical protein
MMWTLSMLRRRTNFGPLLVIALQGLTEPNFPRLSVKGSLGAR